MPNCLKFENKTNTKQIKVGYNLINEFIEFILFIFTKAKKKKKKSKKKKSSILYYTEKKNYY